MKLYALTFGDIMERNVLYYDEQQQEACAHLCQTLKIDYLPALDGLNKYELKGNVFMCSAIDSSQWVDIEGAIFHHDVPALFQSQGHNVLFVRQHGTLIGVVHISDYNRPLVTETIQNWVFEFEHTLRRYLTAMGITDLEMAKFLKQIPLSDTRLHPFQTFLLSHLMRFVREGHALPFSLSKEECEEMRELRNGAMHGKDWVENLNWVYDNASLSILFNRIKALESKLQDLYSRLFQLEKPFRASLNQKKLELLKTSEIAALNFLLSNQ
jgi:hypothetical protein